jgi:hypothetical protein
MVLQNCASLFSAAIILFTQFSPAAKHTLALPPDYYICTMKNIVFFLVAVSSSVVSCVQKSKPLTKEEVIAVISRFDAGWNSKNLKTVDSVLAPGYIYFTQSGGTFSRDSVVATAGSPAYTLEKVTRRDYEVQLLGNTAIASTRWQGRGIYKGIPFDEDQRCSITIVKTGSKVEILSEHCTPVKSASIFH